MWIEILYPHYILENIEYDAAFVAIGDPAVVSPSAVIGEGCIVEVVVVLSTGVKIGKGMVVMMNAVVGHNAMVCDCC